MYSRDEIKALTDKVVNMAKADAVEVSFDGGERSATRWANSSITVNLVQYDQQLTLNVRHGQKQGSASTREFDDESLKAMVDEANDTAQKARDNPNLTPLVKGPQEYVKVDAVVPATADFGPGERAAWVKQSVDICEKKGVLGAGYIPKLHWTDALANSEGLFAYNRYAEASFILTCRTPDGTGSGWAGTTGLKDVTKIDAAGLSEIAADKALRSRKPKALEPGNYTVILESRPAARMLSLMLFALNARPAEEGRSFMSGKERGTTKLGQKIFGENVTIRSDVGNQILRQTPVGPDGLAARPTTWIEKGVVKNLFYDRYWAKKQEKAFTPTSPQQSLVMDGGDATIDQMVKSTRRGLLITFFWYIRPVDQMTLLNTGMTRDGMFLIENGEITAPVQNFRWNDGPARAFNNVSMLGRPVPMHVGEAYDFPGTALVPPMKIEDFRMTSISPAV